MHLNRPLVCRSNIFLHTTYIHLVYSMYVKGLRELNLVRALNEDTRVFSYILLLHWTRELLFEGIPLFINDPGNLSKSSFRFLALSSIWGCLYKITWYTYVCTCTDLHGQPKDSWEEGYEDDQICYYGNKPEATYQL